MWLWGLAVAAAGSTGCGFLDRQQRACGLSAATPSTASHTLEAKRDGNPYSVSNNGGYKLLNDRTDIVAGDVSLYIGKDNDGRSVNDAIAQGKFPICIPLNDQSDGTTYAFVNSSNGSFITTSSYTGTVAILDKDGNELVGRFEFTAQKNGGTDTTRFEEGAFRLPSR